MLCVEGLFFKLSETAHRQQKQKAAAWDKFKEARAGNLKTRWEAEKLYIRQGEEWGGAQCVRLLGKLGPAK
ncbi:TPA: hypothetical protein ACH3X1_015453 [Trebouxia sp. C0004]